MPDKEPTFEGTTYPVYNQAAEILVDHDSDGNPVYLTGLEAYAPNWTLFDIVECAAGVLECWTLYGRGGWFNWEVYQPNTKRCLGEGRQYHAFPARRECRKRARAMAEYLEKQGKE